MLRWIGELLGVETSHLHILVWPLSLLYKHTLVLILSLKRSPSEVVAVCRQRIKFDPTPLTSTIPISSIFCSSPCLINVIPVCLSINLYEAGAQWLSKTNQSCWTAPLLNGRSLAELKETEKYGLGAGKEGCLVHFLRGWAAAATVGSLLGKISAALWSAAEPAITINERKRPVRAHKGEKDNRRQRIRDGEKERGKEGKRETTYEEVRVRQRQIKSTPIRNGRDSAGKS